MTDKYAVIGNPIAHSKSPQIHTIFAAQTGQDIAYEAVLSPLEDFAATIARLRNDGYKGCSVTVPFKFEALQISTQLSERAQAAQAVNTLKLDGETIFGDNTDGAGLVRDIEHNLGVPLSGKRILLVGAGGAAYGAALPLAQACQQLSIFNRTVIKAEQLVQTLAANNACNANVAEPTAPQQFDIVINATSSGLSDSMPSLPNGALASSTLAYDMMYGRETPFMKFARQQNSQVADGLGMLIEQAAEAFNIWCGVRPNTTSVISALRSL